MMPIPRGSALAAMALGLLTALSVATPAGAAVDSQSATITESANLRSSPNTTALILETMPAGTSVEVLCWIQGEPTYGTDLYGSMWLYLSRGGWVHSRLATPVDVDPCRESLYSFGGDSPYGSGDGPYGSGDGPNDSGDGSYDNCDEAPGKVYLGEPGYGRHLDRDGDGIGCELN